MIVSCWRIGSIYCLAMENAVLCKALSAGGVKKVFLADDADPMLTQPLAEQCRALQITVVCVPTMKQLGAACNISVDAAAAAIL